MQRTTRSTSPKSLSMGCDGCGPIFKIPNGTSDVKLPSGFVKPLKECIFIFKLYNRQKENLASFSRSCSQYAATFDLLLLLLI